MGMICEHLHELYTLNSFSGSKGLTKFIPRDCFYSILCSVITTLNAVVSIYIFIQNRFMICCQNNTEADIHLNTVSGTENNTEAGIYLNSFIKSIKLYDIIAAKV